MKRVVFKLCATNDALVTKCVGVAVSGTIIVTGPGPAPEVIGPLSSQAVDSRADA